MDPRLWQIYEQEDVDDVQAIIRLHDPEVLPSGVRVVTQMGHILTVRLPRHDILQVRSDPAVASMKGPEIMRPATQRQSVTQVVGGETDVRRPDLAETGSGVLLGFVDFSIDPFHPSMIKRRSDGESPPGPGGGRLLNARSRLSALWDQRPPPNERSPQPYGYGVVYTGEAIDRALATDDPYQSLGYRPGPGPRGVGSHGAHVADIAGGSGATGPTGMAPRSEIVFVHLSSGHNSVAGTDDVGHLGDSVRVLEAIDFIFNHAGERPVVINMSVGRQGGPHDGLTLVEQAMDASVESAPGRAICQSTGNYRSANAHAYRKLRSGDEWKVVWNITSNDRTANEVEIWVPPIDRVAVTLRSPDGRTNLLLENNARTDIDYEGATVGRAYTRSREPNNGKSHVDIFLYPGAPSGGWEIRMRAGDIVDGRCHLWIERDRPGSSSSFDPANVSSEFTTGTICNGFRTIATGAYDGHRPELPLARFSSIGPTVDGRSKPDLLAPGVAVLAARSEAFHGRAFTTRHSGTSMASPHTAGTVALMFEAATRPLTIDETRRALVESAVKSTDHEAPYLDPVGAVRAARRFSMEPPSALDQSRGTEALEALPQVDTDTDPLGTDHGEDCTDLGTEL